MRGPPWWQNIWFEGSPQTDWLQLKMLQVLFKVLHCQIQSNLLLATICTYTVNRSSLCERLRPQFPIITISQAKFWYFGKEVVYRRWSLTKGGHSEGFNYIFVPTCRPTSLLLAARHLFCPPSCLVHKNVSSTVQPRCNKQPGDWKMCLSQ